MKKSILLCLVMMMTGSVMAQTARIMNVAIKGAVDIEGNNMKNTFQHLWQICI